MNSLQTDKFGDVRDRTVESRKSIGFKNRSAWKEARATFDEHTLKIQGHPVMEDWEDGYMKTLAHIASYRGGVILEVGFGMGISASYIQKHPIDKHIIVEANRDVYKELLLFAKNSRHPVYPLFGFWEEVTSMLSDGSITGILFDTYPLAENEIHKNHFPFFKEAHRLLANGGTLTYYSDEIEDFSDTHLKFLEEAGFKKIDKVICSVTPPTNCEYWTSKTILAPKIEK